ncbi:MAG: hypothetical protein ACKOEX_05385 [Planctomycetia bacterium]
MKPDDLYTFEISVHHHPDSVLLPAAPYADAWGTWSTVAVPHDTLAVPLAMSFDDAIERLGRLDRMYAEPDGSFVWVSRREGLSWQVDGTVFDRSGRVVLVDMKGSCPPADFDRLLSCFGWPGERLLFQLVRPAVFLEENSFRSHALARGMAPSGKILRG